MRSPLRLSVLALLFIHALASISVAQETPADVQQKLESLATQLQQQQQQIETLQRSQQELLDQLKAARAAASTTTGTSNAATAPAPEATSQPKVAQGSDARTGTSETPSSTRAARYVDWQGGGVKIGDDRVKVGGYGSLRFESNDVPSGFNMPGGSASAFTFRRFVVTTDARVAPRLRVYSEIEYERLHGIEAEKGFERSADGLKFKQTTEGNAGGELAVEQAWGQLNFAENHGVRAGVVLVPVGRFNLLHDDDYWDIPRRTLTDRDASVLPVKAAWRDLGAGLVGSFNVGRSGKLDYQVYALNGAALDFNMEQEIETEAGAPGAAELVLNSEMQLSSGFFDGTKSATAVAWRAAYSPSLNGEFALSGYHGKYAPSFLDFREPITSVAYDHKWRWKGFETEAEAVYTSMGRLDRVMGAFGQAAFNSANATLPSGSGAFTSAVVEMELANLSRTRAGVWSDFKYHARPKWLKNSFLGSSFEDPQIIPIVRYERVWLNGVVDDIEIVNGAVAGFSRENMEQERWTAGLSYRPSVQFAVQAAYEHNRRINGSRLIFPKVPVDSTNGMILGMAFSF
ncbi:MAG TPA: hypothetical protein VN622_14740 [Clostridia bacterium]|nr:hypothetical protein [Clostridia bacterium]